MNFRLDPGAIIFRRLSPEDLHLIYRWLNTPHVREWRYDEPTDFDAIQAKYAPLLDGAEPTDPYLILYDGLPIGYVQTYRIAAHEEYARCMDLGEDAGAIDLFIGEEAFVHRGLGAHILRKCLLEEIFGRMGCAVGIVAPEPMNVSAIRCYEKAGFRYLKAIQVPGEPQPEYVMRITRADLVTE